VKHRQGEEKPVSFKIKKINCSLTVVDKKKKKHLAGCVFILSINKSFSGALKKNNNRNVCLDFHGQKFFFFFFCVTSTLKLWVLLFSFFCWSISQSLAPPYPPTPTPR
jgi:hypothetical protein